MSVGLLEQAVRRWGALQPRERRVVGIGGGLALVAILYLAAFEPAWDGRRRLQAELPALRGQLAQIEGLAAEARRLSSAPSQATDSPQQMRAALERSIEAAGLKDTVAQLTVAGDLIDLRFRSVGFPAWLDWLEQALRETRLRAVDVTLEREASPGVVSARLTLETPKREP